MYEERKRMVRSPIRPANANSPWSSVKIAKEEDNDPIPNSVHLGGDKYYGNEVPEAFATFFNDKVSDITASCTMMQSIMASRYHKNQNIHKKSQPHSKFAAQFKV